MSQQLRPLDQQVQHLYHASDELNQRDMPPPGSIHQAISAMNHPCSIESSCASYNSTETSLGFAQQGPSLNTVLKHPPPNSAGINQIPTQDNNAALYSSMQPAVEANKSINDCTTCIVNNRDRSPFDKVVVCDKCQRQWINFLPSSNPLNTDSSVIHMLQEQCIRLTRAMSQELIDGFGFGPNVHGYRRHRLIKLCFPQDKIKRERLGVLCRLYQGRVQVWVPELRMSEWLPIGTRRIQLMDPQEEKDAELVLRGSFRTMDDVELLSVGNQNQQAQGISHSKRARSSSPAQKRPLNTGRRQHGELTKANPSDSPLDTIAPSTVKGAYLTTGAFATRNAVHQLKDDNGFIPNPFGYAKNQAVQILDTKHGKSASWYNGTLVAMRPGYVKVHYNQWSETYDEWLMVGSRRIRIADGASATRNCTSSSDEQLMVMIEDPDAQHDAKRKRQLSEKQHKGQPGTSCSKRPITSRRLAQLKAAQDEEFAPNLYGYYYMQHVNVLYHDKKYYEARIVDVQKNKVKIHYCGWTDNFDELVPNGSQRIQPIDTEKCLDPEYLVHKRNVPLVESPASEDEAASVHDLSQEMKAQEAIQLDASTQKGSEEQEEDIIVVDNNEMVEADTSKVHCSYCRTAIENSRYYCTYCEASSSTSKDTNMQSFQLCLYCFNRCFPDWHPHPRSGFAIQAITDSPNQSQASQSLTSPMWEEDIMETQEECMDEAAMSLEASKIFTGADDITAQDEHGYLYLQRWSNRKICGFCNDDDDNSQELGSFVGPFVSTMTKLGQEKKRTFWVHDACARYSPEVRFSAVDGKWYNVTRALKRGRSMRCFACKEKGATIGCFDSRCSKSFHLPCTNKPVNNFRNGVIFRCPIHEAAHEKEDAYIDVFHCDHCRNQLFDDETWYTSKKAHLLPRRSRKVTNESTPTSCCYCGTTEAETWRKGYEGGILMCNTCFGMIYDQDLPAENASERSVAIENYVASVEEYSHKPYFTRDTLSMNKSLIGSRLTSYGPQSNQLFSLTFDSTYFDIPGRAPRWATHSGTDYHGTWLPQTVRRSLLRYTKKDERILSNFLGRGTDAIECFLLQRKCCGIDINPVAVALSQRNCCFEVPAGLTFAEYRPIIALADTRQLNGSLFGDESYHHILSHPPYKDCVAYSTHLEGDLSRIPKLDDFKAEYTRVVQESYRVLKMDRRLTLGIGDNREHCFYVPVGFHLIRLYIDQGFELEELIIKRQRYCSAYGLGTYLCVQFDFLIFTHEFIATFRKVPKQQVDKMLLKQENFNTTNSKPLYTTTLYGVPHSAIPRNSRVMGTVWTFKLSHQYSFQLLCIGRMIERFGRDDCNWLHVELTIDETSQKHQQQRQESGTTSADKLPITCTPSVMEVDDISEYEQERQRKIQENKETLLKLGLISDLSQDSVVNDSIYCDTIFTKQPHSHADLAVMATGHIETLLPHQIDMYRKSIIQLAQDATDQLTVKGMLIIGTKDIRDEISGKLWPVSMLVLEDVERVSHGLLKLKEMVITVPEGYARDKDAFGSESPVEKDPPEHLPIVHAIYFVFQRQ
ncbi:hypothetical protein MUCCIDRAFT_114945 [Mucor lusitanicus CBS 277.49]|uniref:PHD-type domain-containing protein n=1 Tax=Mucor lusitanicus CBS 277.49 TaxID=747725 RepID=A0A168HEN6_MUCCL|nr:hypothetical protein MUCCIDRAFT_114945 [Mucor lusitanicus CBS 277.49]